MANNLRRLLRRLAVDFKSPVALRRRCPTAKRLTWTLMKCPWPIAVMLKGFPWSDGLTARPGVVTSSHQCGNLSEDGVKGCEGDQFGKCCHQKYGNIWEPNSQLKIISQLICSSMFIMCVSFTTWMTPSAPEKTIAVSSHHLKWCDTVIPANSTVPFAARFQDILWI